MKEIQPALNQAISDALVQAEKDQNIVITTNNIHDISALISDKVKTVYAGGLLSPEEIKGLYNLINHAVQDKSFYDWEMPILIGYTAEQMDDLAKKLLASINN